MYTRSKQSIIILLFVLLSPLFGNGQTPGFKNNGNGYFISGTVTDKNGQPVAGATVFLGQTQKTTASDANGGFSIYNIPNGSYQLVVKMMGFNTWNDNIVINGANTAIKITLVEENRLLNEVSVTAKPNDSKYLETFLRYFIGDSENSSQCKLTNPGVLRFSYKNNVLTASATDMLIIENRGLGYRIRYSLSAFTYDYIKRITYYAGFPYFEELEGSNSQKQQWLINRENTYQGSVMHFFRSIVNNNLTGQDFATYDGTGITGIGRSDFAVALGSLWPMHPIGDGIVYVKPQKSILVDFEKATEGISKITPEADSVIIDANGGFTSTSLLFSGYWAGKAIAEMLPLDYQPAIDNNMAHRQSSPAQKIAATIDSFNMRLPTEKVFMQTDRPAYINNDTIWFKAYILDAGLNYSRQSGLLYAELVNDTGKVVMRQSMPIKLGISFSQMVLDEKTVPEGSYILRAYTNWMQNQGAESFYRQPLYISAINDDLMVNYAGKPSEKNGKDSLNLALQFYKTGNDPARLQAVQLTLLNGANILNRDKLQTDMEGKLNVKFGLPGRTSKKLVLMVKNTGSDKTEHQLAIPLSINRPQNIDLQFMPEGGRLVSGLPSYLAFKAVGEDGNGIEVEGNILDQDGNIVAPFQSTHMGMGSFRFTPSYGKSYTAKLTSPAGNNQAYPVGIVTTEGLVMHVSNPPGKDSVLVTVYPTEDMMQDSSSYSLIGVARGKVCYAANISLTGGVVHGAINKMRFPSGITHFILFNAKREPLAERIVFIDHDDQLRISIVPGKQTYQPKDSIALQIKATDRNNLPVQGSFSLAITDDNQVKQDDAKVVGIENYTLLGSDLKGDIENPGYYFDPKNADRFEALDNLLLTQGWVSYNWQDVFDPKYNPAFKAETEREVTGQISRVGGKAVSGLQVMLLSVKKPFLVRDTISDANGRFAFRELSQIDTANFLIQVKDKKGRMFEATVNVDEFKPAKTNDLNIPLLQPWYVNTDSTLLNNMNSNIAYNKIEEKIQFGGSRLLKEVKVKAVKTVKGSHNLNGPGNADQVLDEADMKKLDKTPLFDLLLKQIKGFNYKVVIPTTICSCPTRAYYAIYEKQIRFVIDGVNIDFFYNPQYRGMDDSLVDYDYVNFEKNMIDQFTAEDIKGIEVLYSSKYTGKYRIAHDSQLAVDPVDWNAVPPTYAETMYVEITTWSGDGFFEKRKSGNAIYRPLPISWPKQFYKPKYTAKTTNILAELRPTVLWEPNIITDTAGKATVWFYAKSKKTNYTGLINGSDLNGSVGSAKINIAVK